MYGLSTPYKLTIRNSARLLLFHHVLFYMGKYWRHFDNGAIFKIDDVLTEHGGLPHVLPLAVHLRFFFLLESLRFVAGPLLHA